MKTSSTGHVPRLYLEQSLLEHSQLELPATRAHHLHTVLRRRVGDSLQLFNGDGRELEGEIIAIDKKAVVVALHRATRPRRESGLRITLAQAVSQAERMDYSIAKAIELGVQVITLIHSERVKNRLSGERLDKKMRHWQRIAISAAEQSGRLMVPFIPAPLVLEEFLCQPVTDCGVILDPAAQCSLAGLARPQALTLLIGPEAGFAETEVAAAARAGYRRVGLGPRVLRTETAGPAALAAAQTLWGDFSG